ncbi:MAG: hypothetical protein HYZ28_28730 [Myxococcales bacterium]|nr:hypothetical protein [Myxococcales bacterium]
MGKLLVVLLGFFCLMGAAYYYLQGRQVGGAGASEKSAPKQRLDNVREAAKRIEDDAQRRAEETLGKAQE